MNARDLDRYAPYALSILRVVAALVLWQYGIQKLLQFPNPAAAVPPTGSLIWFAGIIELLLPPLLLVGLFTRPVAFLLAGHLAFVYFIGHAPRGFYPSMNGGNLPIVYCFLFLYLVFAGGGAWSMDRVIWRKPAWD